MPSSLYNCVNTADVAQVAAAAASYEKMANLDVIVDAAKTAGETLRLHMQGIVYGEPSISQYKDVGDGFRVWADNQNVYVGIPEDDPLEARALQMDQNYQVNEVAEDLALQSGGIEEKFLAELAAAAS